MPRLFGLFDNISSRISHRRKRSGRGPQRSPTHHRERGSTQMEGPDRFAGHRRPYRPSSLPKPNGELWMTPSPSSLVPRLPSTDGFGPFELSGRDEPGSLRGTSSGTRHRHPTILRAGSSQPPPRPHSYNPYRPPRPQAGQRECWCNHPDPKVHHFMCPLSNSNDNARMQAGNASGYPFPPAEITTAELPTRETSRLHWGIEQRVELQGDEEWHERRRPVEEPLVSIQQHLVFGSAINGGKFF